MLYRNLLIRLEHDESEHLIVNGNSTSCEGRKWLQSAAPHSGGDSGATRSCSLCATSRGTNLFQPNSENTSRIGLETPAHSVNWVLGACTVDMVNGFPCLFLHRPQRSGSLGLLPTIHEGYAPAQVHQPDLERHREDALGALLLHGFTTWLCLVTLTRLRRLIQPAVAVLQESEALTSICRGVSAVTYDFVVCGRSWPSRWTRGHGVRRTSGELGFMHIITRQVGGLETKPS